MRANGTDGVWIEGRARGSRGYGLGLDDCYWVKTPGYGIDRAKGCQWQLPRRGKESQARTRAESGWGCADLEGKQRALGASERDVVGGRRWPGATSLA